MASASASKSSIHTNLQSNTKQPCNTCGYNHPHGHCPAFHKICYNCNNTSHFTALFRCRELRGRSPRSASRSRRRSSSRSLSRSPIRGRQTYRSPSRYSSRSPSQDHHRRRSPCRRRCSPAPHRHRVSHIMSFNPTTTCNEGQLYTDQEPDGQTSFHTTLQMVTKQGCKPLPVKVDPGADINTIPLTHYKTIFPQHFPKDGHLKKNVLRSTASTWSPHDGQRKHFLGFFTVDIQHKTLPKLIPLSFYIFQDTTNPHLLLSYSASVHLGIVEFKIQMKWKQMPWLAQSQTPGWTRKCHIKFLYVLALQLKWFQWCLHQRNWSSNEKQQKTSHFRITTTLCRMTTQQMMIQHRYILKTSHSKTI